jgi:hypothetical protein
LGRGISLGRRLLRVCLVASSLLLCRACDLPAMAGLPQSTFVLAYTAEGLEEDVEAEMTEVQSVLETQGVSSAVQARDDDLPSDASHSEGPQISGSVLWARWMSEQDRVVRVGVPPRDVTRLMVDLGPVAGKTPFVVDFASGMVYLGQVPDTTAVRRLALDLGGYAIVLPPPDGRTMGLDPVDDPWGYSPDGLDLMRALKARWDPRSLLNPGAFII